MNFEERVRSNSGFIGVSLFWVSDDIDGLAEEELAKLVERLDKTSAASGMEISAEKIKLMTKKKTHQRHQHRCQSKWTET